MTNENEEIEMVEHSGDVANVPELKFRVVIANQESIDKFQHVYSRLSEVAKPHMSESELKTLEMLFDDAIKGFSMKRIIPLGGEE